MNHELLRQMEREVIGTCLTLPERLMPIFDRVVPELFASVAHQAICRAVRSLVTEGVGIGITTVELRLRQLHIGEKVGVVELAELVRDANPSGQVRYLVEQLEVAAKSRVIRKAAARILDVTEGDHDPMQVLSEFELTVALPFGGSGLQFRPLSVGLRETVEAIDRAYKGTGPIGISTGLRDLDAIIGGWFPSDLIVIGSRPGMGKTSLLLNALYAAAKQGKHAALMSIEMSEQDVDERLIGIASGVLQPSELRKGHVSKDGWIEVTNACMELEGLPCVLLDHPGITIDELVRAVRIQHAQKPIDLLIVDYLQLVESDRRNLKREQIVTEVTRRLRGLARELKFPVITSASLNRDAEKRDDKRPRMSDLRESGNIESDADVIIFLYRPEVDDKLTSEVGICELIVRKNRHGPVDDVVTEFDGPTMRFLNSDRRMGE